MGTHLLGDVMQLPNELPESREGRRHRAWGGETTKAGESDDQGQPERHGAQSTKERSQEQSRRLA